MPFPGIFCRIYSDFPHLRKHDAIVGSGIPILKRYDLPGTHVHTNLNAMLMRAELDHLIPMDSRVEIDAKIAAGYFTSGKQVTTQDLSKTVGRAWEEADH
jgi:hypothetical protein